MKSQQNIKILPKLKVYRFFVFFSIFTFSFFVANAQVSKFTVVLDAGHGGKDPGTVGLKTFKKSYESDVALKVVKKIGAFLKKETDIKTVYTRATNKFIELHKRGKIANKAQADLFISVHCNAAVTNAHGTTTYVLGMGKTPKNLELSKRENSVVMLEDGGERNYKFNPNDPNSQEFIIGLTMMQEDYLERSIEFAGIVQNKFVTVAKRKNRGVNQGNLAVLYDTYMPSVLIEIGFLTNKAEEKFLHTPLGQSKIAEAIYKAIKTYKKRLEKNSIVVDDYLDEEPEKVVKTTSSSKYYKIQIASSTKKIEAKGYNFKGLSPIERVKVGKIYKYFYAVANNLSDAKKLRLKAVKEGFKDAFIAKFNFDKSKGDVYQLHYVNPFKNKKKSTKKTKKVVKSSPKSTSSSRIFNDVDFKVLLSSSVKKVETKSYNFKGLKNVERVKVGKYYKYYYGKTHNYNEILKSKKKARAKGYTTAYVVAVKNGKLVSLATLLK